MFNNLKALFSSKSEIQVNPFEDLFTPYAKIAYQIIFDKKRDIQDCDSFTSKTFVGSKEISISKNTSEIRTFLMQLKHPELNVWYRMYVSEKDMGEVQYCTNTKNGELFFIQEFYEKPKLEFHPEIKTDVYVPLEIQDCEISFEKLNHLPEVVTLLKDPEIKALAEKLAQEENIDEFDIVERYRKSFVGANNWCNHFLGYPIWLQAEELPEGFTLDDFLFEISADDFPPNRNSMGISLADDAYYIFKNKNDFAVVRQSS